MEGSSDSDDPTDEDEMDDESDTSDEVVSEAVPKHEEDSDPSDDNRREEIEEEEENKGEDEWEDEDEDMEAANSAISDADSDVSFACESAPTVAFLLSRYPPDDADGKKQYNLLRAYDKNVDSEDDDNDGEGGDASLTDWTLMVTWGVTWALCGGCVAMHCWRSSCCRTVSIQRWAGERSVMGGAC